MKKLIICAICAICGFTTANAQSKFGHVNTQEIIQAMPEYSKAESEIKALQSQYEADLKSMQDELQKKGEAFDKEQATLPDNIKQRRQQELQDMYQKIQQSFQDNQQALQKASQEKMQAIQAKVLDAIKSVGQTNGYVYIMEDNSLPYISSTLSTDVTAQVKAKLGLK
ncbi:periplasmic chaperone for outer membrane proteins Skp [Xylanibacter ruminicola]|jgi:outer membrane protein|uniref:Periplasmic chaperone for outer membrane proteins Skp n=1 Tax=Xylanibacter ruminicola TaxID=839 RepID=A0A1H5SWG4_XYLRU|nr:MULTISPECIES: OmpH family outer membrane protein [Prevotellaceae]MCR5471337.1 OmpH family outer membrane protein [Prevotella sp.]SEF54127.1 periplasmic chaperone for outer membrane proteins Skp [Xylanibacter ruminicola]SEV94580.1 periplasmic chaperone for outer membrane proteins Skp [Prevotella sp. khp7]